VANGGHPSRLVGAGGEWWAQEAILAWATKTKKLKSGKLQIILGIQSLIMQNVKIFFQHSLPFTLNAIITETAVAASLFPSLPFDCCFENNFNSLMAVMTHSAAANTNIECQKCHSCYCQFYVQFIYFIFLPWSL